MNIGSSAVARNVVGLVLGHVTSIVVDLAVLIEVTSLMVSAVASFFRSSS